VIGEFPVTSYKSEARAIASIARKCVAREIEMKEWAYPRLDDYSVKPIIQNFAE
jgi:hypothetical protein